MAQDELLVTLTHLETQDVNPEKLARVIRKQNVGSPWESVCADAGAS